MHGFSIGIKTEGEKIIEEQFQLKVERERLLRRLEGWRGPRWMRRVPEIRGRLWWKMKEV